MSGGAIPRCARGGEGRGVDASAFRVRCRRRFPSPSPSPRLTILPLCDPGAASNPLPAKSPPSIHQPPPRNCATPPLPPPPPASQPKRHTPTLSIHSHLRSPRATSAYIRSGSHHTAARTLRLSAPRAPAVKAAPTSSMAPVNIARERYPRSLSWPPIGAPKRPLRAKG